MIYYQTGHRTYIDVDYGYKYEDVRVTTDFSEAYIFYRQNDRNYLWEIDVTRDKPIRDWNPETGKWDEQHIE